MHYFGVKTLSETLFSPPLMKSGYGARYAGLPRDLRAERGAGAVRGGGGAALPLRRDAGPRGPLGAPTPRKPRNFGIMEGGRKRVLDIVIDKHSVACT